MTTNFDSLLLEFRRSLEVEGVAAASLRAYQADVHAFAAWFEKTTGETFDPASIVRRDLLEWREEQMNTGKPASLNRRLSSLRAFFAWAQRKGLVSLDPTNRLHGTSVRASPPPPPSDETLECILQQARLKGSPRDRALLELLAATGLRVREVAALRVANFELGASFARMTVPADDMRRRREVPVNVRARVALREYLEARGIISPDQPLFAGRGEASISPYAIWYAVKKYARLAEITNISPLSFRRAVARRLANDPQVGLVNAARQLGHRRLDMLAEYTGDGAA